MAIYWPLNNGIWSTLSNWGSSDGILTGVAGALPASADDVYADNKTITIDTNFRVNLLTTAQRPSPPGGVSGGGFRLNANTSISASLITMGATTCVTFASASPNYAEIICGTIEGFEGATNRFTVANSGTGTLGISGIVGSAINITAGNASRAVTNAGTMIIRGIVRGYGIISSGVLNVFGEVYATGGQQRYAIENSGGVVNVVGNIRGADAATGAFSYGILNSTGTINVTGNVTGGAGTTNEGIGNSNASSCVVNIIGNVVGRSCPGVSNIIFGRSFGGGFINIMGDVSGSSGISGVTNGFDGVVNLSGRAVGGTAVGLAHTGSNTVYVTRAVGGPGGPLNTTGGTAAGVSNTQNGQLYVQEVEFGAQGASPISGPVFMLPRSTNVTVMNQGLFNFTPVTLFRATNYPGLVPPASSVRFGTVYGNGDFTGTMVVPNPASVQLGVAVDNTVGTAALTPATVWNYSRSTPMSAGSMGERLRNAVTTDIVGSIIASFGLSSG